MLCYVKLVLFGIVYDDDNINYFVPPILLSSQNREILYSRNMALDFLENLVRIRYYCRSIHYTSKSDSKKETGVKLNRNLEETGIKGRVQLYVVLTKAEKPISCETTITLA